VQAPPYLELEHCLGEMLGGHALVVPSTTLGHVATLPVLVGSQDAVIVDQQVHQSVQMAVDHLRCQGTVIEVINHSDVSQLEAAVLVAAISLHLPRALNSSQARVSRTSAAHGHPSDDGGLT
jgi:7-keto-8-aminopelargonate synthetase-like enzyme